MSEYSSGSEFPTAADNQRFNTALGRLSRDWVQVDYDTIEGYIAVALAEIRERDRQLTAARAEAQQAKDDAENWRKDVSRWKQNFAEVQAEAQQLREDAARWCNAAGVQEAENARLRSLLTDATAGLEALEDAAGSQPNQSSFAIFVAEYTSTLLSRLRAETPGESV